MPIKKNCYCREGQLPKPTAGGAALDRLARYAKWTEARLKSQKAENERLERLAALTFDVDAMKAFLAQSGHGARARTERLPMTSRQLIFELKQRSPEAKARVEAALLAINQNAGLAMQPETCTCWTVNDRYFHRAKTHCIWTRTKWPWQDSSRWTQGFYGPSSIKATAIWCVAGSSS